MSYLHRDALGGLSPVATDPPTPERAIMDAHRAAIAGPVPDDVAAGAAGAARGGATLMIMLVNGATQTVQRYAGHPHLGRLTQPESGNDLDVFGAADCDKGADNNCLQGFDLDRWMAMCERLRGARRLRFVAAPDAVELTPRGPRGSWEGTLWLFRRFAPWLRARGLPVAIVSQDGAIVETVPWDAIDALFIGGSDAHKCGPEAAYLIAAAKRRGKWVHIGRVNSKKRIDTFRTLGWLDGFRPDSFDGGQFSMFPDTYIPDYLAFLGQRTLEEAA